VEYETCDVLIVGGGPTGLRAAELVSAAGKHTVLADRMRSFGRKFLVAGKGGLNLTHAEAQEAFLGRYGEPRERWKNLLSAFSPDDLRVWAAELGIETFIGTSQRIFPVGKQAAPLLRRWIERLRKQGVSFRKQHRLAALRRESSNIWEVEFEYPEGRHVIRAQAVILAMGGASWPQTGSDGAWTELLGQKDVPIAPLAPANCGYEADWPADFLAEAEGLPLKNVEVSASGQRVAGELLITKYGLEGGAIYQLGRTLRSMRSPEIHIDLKPGFTSEQLLTKLGHAKPALEHAAQAWRLSPVAKALLRLRAPFASSSEMAAAVKAFSVRLRRPRPIEEAISTAGGVAWESLDADLMLKAMPGVFCAGEMIDWEAPTGGYLLQGCFATGTRAAAGALRWGPANKRLSRCGEKL
jgi:uncharacterized flavoprotein (TIGR03862 family)